MDEKKKQELAVNINLDTTPILYTDNVIITVNPDGVVLDVTQRLANTNQVRVVARIGMSREQAKKLTTELGKILALTGGQAKTGSNN
ncbi:MAG: hypothetical protein M1444_00110 [Patescibacteria group bacterium]|nr:hypothetical protein [Patescibacteria group bacterium]